MPKPWILLIGGGGHAKACIDVIEQEGKYRIYGIIDGPALRNNQTRVFNYPILGGDEILESTFKKVQCAFIAVGQITTPTPRVNIYQNLKRIGYNLPHIISPLAHIARNVQISEGSIIMHHALINTNAKVGKVCIINSKALVEHDCEVGDFCHLSTASVLNGGCTIGEKSFVGSNMIIPHTTHLASQSLLYSNPLESHPRYTQATSLESRDSNSKHLTGGGIK